MAKMIIIFVFMSLAFFGSSQSVTFDCDYKTGGWSTLDTIYWCYVQNAVRKTSLDAAQVDDISGPHKAGYNNDNVEGFYVTQGQIHYFPRGINKYFENLKAIEVSHTGLKEIHQSDLKDFPNLEILYLEYNNLEVLEANLFEFNPNLEEIHLGSNKISHIDLNVFDKLTKMKRMYLDHNFCIDMYAHNPTEVQKVIKAAKAQCTNSDYSNLEQIVKNIEIESKNLNSENFKELLEKLENEIKKSRFSNTFHRRLQDLKAAQVKKVQTTTTTTEPTTTTSEVLKEPEINTFETCSTLELKVNNNVINLMDLVTQAGNGTHSAFKDQDTINNSKYEANHADLRNQKEAINKKLENLESKIEEFKSESLKEINQIKNIVKKMENKIEEVNRKLDENMTKIMKALKIND